MCVYVFLIIKWNIILIKIQAFGELCTVGKVMSSSQWRGLEILSGDWAIGIRKSPGVRLSLWFPGTITWKSSVRQFLIFLNYSVTSGSIFSRFEGRLKSGLTLSLCLWLERSGDHKIESSRWATKSWAAADQNKVSWWKCHGMELLSFPWRAENGGGEVCTFCYLGKLGIVVIIGWTLKKCNLVW